MVIHSMITPIPRVIGSHVKYIATEKSTAKLILIWNMACAGNDQSFSYMNPINENPQPIKFDSKNALIAS